MLPPISFLADELTQNGIAADAPELIEHPAVLAELSYALSPVVHEGKLEPYGFIVAESKCFSPVQKTHDKLLIHLPEARRIADGCHSFSIFKDGQFRGVFLPQYAAYTELQLVQLQQELNVTICITDTSGVTKLFCDAGLFIHQYRTWQKKPCINSALQNICRCVPQANPEILQDLLEFCFYDLSPRRIGATLVWCLAEPSAEELENMRPNFMLQEIDTRVGSDRSVAVLRHLLTYTDGAAILDTQAKAIGVGSQLKYSEASKRLIEAQAGTRHTSAQRFSYDFAKAIVFVVSSDGPVTVFSDGMSVTDLKVHFTDRFSSQALEDISMPELSAFSCSSELTCPRCTKRLKVEEADIAESKRAERTLYCPICGQFLYTAQCENLDIYVVKELLQEEYLQPGLR
ncbi:DNA integrity scanning protein DisA nucleotide-binding domain protein [Phormidium tenue FACHB-886]|nr:DNA integrity scanning protein DisA nucleotide-binding domain protein [Phormidium tenue FACHB-886]